ncbi:MAG: DUF4231 domain-containing protein [Deltaproteobacteria bacterium]|nr:MAG: DUF4231 domain-containing protein [Deltaproteobacteria bacterium]TMQ23815.1 MAG: DUF4231 domain-containing protein [Deltaproteobacteria bacterium]
MAEHETLRHAWQRFGAFDTASAANQTRFLRLRSVILIVGVVAAAAGLLSTAASDAATKDPNGPGAMMESSIRWLTFTASLALAGLFAFAARFDRGSAWVLSRRSAELIQREIFLYRTRRGPYKAAGGDAAKLDAILAAQLHAFNRDAPRQFGLAKDGEFGPRIVRTPSGQPLGLAGGATDDGLSALSADDYARMRITGQRTWYCDKAARARSRLQIYHVSGIVIGLGGAILAFAGGGWVAWVAVTTAIAAAVASWSELRRLEPTAAAYEHAASDLDDVLLWWRALSDDGRAAEDNFDKLVTESEAVIESENATWTQDMRKRVAELKAEAEQRAAAGKPK